MNKAEEIAVFKMATEILGLLDAGVGHRTFFVPFANHIFDLVDGNMLNNTYLALSLAWFEQFS